MTNPRDEIRLSEVDADRILQALSDRQHLRPHESLDLALSETSDALGFCPGAAETALEWLQLDSSISVGRLRRTELVQLARSIHRFWRQSLAGHDVRTQPA